MLPKYLALILSFVLALDAFAFHTPRGMDQLTGAHHEAMCDTEDDFACHSGSVACIPGKWVCDDFGDCDDGSDELFCIDGVPVFMASRG